MGFHPVTAGQENADRLALQQTRAVSGRPDPAAVTSPYAIWSPHRDSREVTLWKSMLAFRAEPWHWVDDAALARWHVVDVARGVRSEWTERLGARPGIKGIALARHWIDLPAPCWTFFKVPLHSERVLIWLDQEVNRQRHLRQAHAEAVPPVPAPAEPPNWASCELRLTRWPDVTRYSDGSLDLTVACGMLLRNWVSYEAILATVRDQRSFNAMLADAQRRSFLQVAPRTADKAAAPVFPSHAANDSDATRWGLLKRIWKRFS